MSFKVIQTTNGESVSDGLKEKTAFKNSGKETSFPQSIKPRLSINDLILFAHLGCSSKERRMPQEIRFSIEMEFPTAPTGEKTDRLEDTLCYETVCETLRNFVKSRPFHLIEKMARECLSVLQKNYPSMGIRLTLHKKTPPINGLEGGVKYTCGETYQ